jgi:AraC-like DNA-binding protein
MSPASAGPNYTVSVSLLEGLMQLLDAMGVNSDAILRAHRLSRVQLTDSEARMPLELAARLWESAAHVSASPDLAFRLAERPPVGMLGAVFYAVRCRATLGEALRRLERLHPLIVDVGEVDLVEEGNRARLVLQLPSPDRPIFRQLAEGYLAGWLKRSRDMVGLDWKPRVVRFRHSRPASIEAHRRLFRAPIEFDQPANELELDRRLLTTRTKTADPVLAALLDHFVDGLLARLPPVNDFSLAVRQWVSTNLREGRPTLANAATHFHMSERTLQRRLTENGITLRRIVDDSRRELAMLYMGRPEISIAELGARLGFEAPTSFYRSFRRWTGRSPAKHRAR